MIVDIPYTKRKFEEFNRLMFGGELPEIPIYLSDAKTFLGKFCFKKRKLPNGKTAYYDFSLRMNTRLDLPEQEVEDTIIHEMIHYFIAYKNLEDASAHGPIFQHIMKSINERFGRHLTISYKTTAAEREALQDKRPRYHVVAVLQLCDGRFAVKVLPRIMQRIVYYYNQMKKQPTVAYIQLFMSNDIFFNRYPNSSALNARIVDEEEVMAHLEGAEVLQCDGNTIIRGKKT